MAGLPIQVPTFGAAPPRPAVEKKLTVDGVERRYRIFVPSQVRAPAPLVLVFHGGGGNSAQMERYTRFDELAEKEGFIVVYPESVGGNWNDGRGAQSIRAQRENIDDIKFVRAVVDDVAREHQVDRGRVFATGISNGGFISHRLAAEASDLVAAVAPVVGGMAPDIGKNFKPKYPVSALIIQGDADPLIPIAGGDVATRFGKRGQTISAADIVGKYVARNGAAGKPAIETLDVDPNDGVSVEIARYPDGRDGAKTEFYLVKGGGHCWPGRPRYLPEAQIGKASQDFSATEVIWEFFKKCPARKE